MATERVMANIFEWYGGDVALKELGYRVGQEVDAFRAMKRAYKAGYNVMLSKGQVGNILFISKGLFKQR